MKLWAKGDKHKNRKAICFEYVIARKKTEVIALIKKKA
jgi:hypothetical protein